MRIAITGTPGTGKTTATTILEGRLEDYDVIYLNDLLEREGLYTSVDEERDSKVADLDALEERLAERDDVLVESHLSHHLPADRVAVLRCAPEVLEKRLRERGERTDKAHENAESEALDVILSEAVDHHGLESVYEIDTTDREPTEVADELEAVVRGTRAPSAGEVDFVGYLT
ncbi:adenylate kinase family protein [Natronosalvus rutilus]|uniref:Putative adenylate kinase n=1 Tax=Natronosalvus rutilus TaxID=2953753 RepID=A0A9E7N8R7_9EURY|nr:adenylate kinase family protein [Natronosalvus rutilus]UTF52941.1 adenylate kinase family protein [Natronosalvus rutilus]